MSQGLGSSPIGTAAAKILSNAGAQIRLPVNCLSSDTAKIIAKEASTSFIIFNDSIVDYGVAEALRLSSADISSYVDPNSIRLHIAGGSMPCLPWLAGAPSSDGRYFLRVVEDGALVTTLGEVYHDEGYYELHTPDIDLYNLPAKPLSLIVGHMPEPDFDDDCKEFLEDAIRLQVENGTFQDLVNALMKIEELDLDLDNIPESAVQILGKHPSFAEEGDDEN